MANVLWMQCVRGVSPRVVRDEGQARRLLTCCVPSSCRRDRNSLDTKGVAFYRPQVAISYLIECKCTPRPSPIFTWHRWVVTEGATEVVALKAGTASIKLSGKRPYGCVQGTDTQGVSDGPVGSQVVGFPCPAPSAVLSPGVSTPHLLLSIVRPTYQLRSERLLAENT